MSHIFLTKVFPASDNSRGAEIYSFGDRQGFEMRGGSMRIRAAAVAAALFLCAVNVMSAQNGQ
jgi:hypothetical protein